MQDHALLPFDTSAIKRVIEQRARQADDSERLSMNMRSLDDLLTEADYWARQRDGSTVTAKDVVEAIDHKKKRLGRIQGRVYESIERETLLIDTSGDCIGQVNGLSVLDLGDYRFGHPVRITATTRIGTGNVVDIERDGGWSIGRSQLVKRWCWWLGGRIDIRFRKGKNPLPKLTIGPG